MSDVLCSKFFEEGFIKLINERANVKVGEEHSIPIEDVSFQEVLRSTAMAMVDEDILSKSKPIQRIHLSKSMDQIIDNIVHYMDMIDKSNEYKEDSETLAFLMGTIKSMLEAGGKTVEDVYVAEFIINTWREDGKAVTPTPFAEWLEGKKADDVINALKKGEDIMPVSENDYRYLKSVIETGERLPRNIADRLYFAGANTG